MTTLSRLFLSLCLLGLYVERYLYTGQKSVLAFSDNNLNFVCLSCNYRCQVGQRSGAVQWSKDGFLLGKYAVNEIFDHTYYTWAFALHLHCCNDCAIIHNENVCFYYSRTTTSTVQN